jgi:hypothetical protein
MRLPRPALWPLALALACDSQPSPEERRVREWLLCDECTAGEQEAVVALRDTAVDALATALWSPPERGHRIVRRQAAAAYARLPSPGMSEETYVAHFDSNYIASYQKRAALALQAIGTPRARAVLLDALRRDVLYRRDVRRVLGRSVGSVLSIVEGDSQHAPVDSFVRRRPKVLVSDSGGQPLSSVRVVFTVDYGGGTVTPSIRFTDSDGMAAVDWRLGQLGPDSIHVLRAVAAGRIVRFDALTHPIGPRLVFLVEPSDGTAGQPISPPPTIAVQDEWGETQVGLDQPDGLVVSVAGIQTLHDIVGGVATLPNYSVPVPGSALQLDAQFGTAGAVSAPFNMAP